ncbi:MAG TPA: hypothetical protein PKH05_18220, partial [Nitrospira sp.]|nr:hypothetical protein [Nitrospira sp.]
MLLSDGKAIEEAKRSEFKDYLLGESGFLFNGQLLSVSRFKSLRTATEHPEFEIVLSITDYYTYRI